METVAWLGSILLALCVFPQAWKSFKDKHSDGLSHGMLFLWFSGEILLVIYTANINDWALLFNYATNVLGIMVIYRYKLWPKRQS